MSEFAFHIRDRLAPALLAGALLFNAACSDEQVAETPPTASAEPTSTTEQNLTQNHVSVALPTAEQIVAQPESLPFTTSDLGLTSLDTLDDVELVHSARAASRYLPLLEIHSVDDALNQHDVSPEGMDPSVRDWLAGQIGKQRNIIQEAIQSGHISSVEIGLKDDRSNADLFVGQGGMFGYFDPEERKLVLLISTAASEFSADFLAQYITHETTHALLAPSSLSYFSGGTPDPEIKSVFDSACDTFRTIVLEQADTAMQPIAEATRLFATGAVEPAVTARFSALADALENGEWVSLQPTNTAYNTLVDSNDEIVSSKTPYCEITGWGRTAALLAEQQGLPDLLDNASITDNANPGSFDTAHDGYGNVFRSSTLYSLFTEGNYEIISPSMGHPEDGWDEFGASVANVITNYPDQLATNLRALPEDHQIAVLNIVHGFVRVLSEEHPPLASFYEQQEATLLSLI